MAIWSILKSFGIFCSHLVYFVPTWYILRPFGMFCGHLGHFVAIWYILWPFGIFCGHLVYFVVILCIIPFLVCSSNKNLATLAQGDGRARFAANVVDRF
jgi:hypothetical protein